MFQVKDRMPALGSAVLVIVLMLGLVACGDDAASSTTASAPTTEEYCIELQQAMGDDDSGPYDAFYEAHPEPTPADWAADGHLVTDALQEDIDALNSVEPSAEAQPIVGDLLAAFEVIKQNSLDTVEAGRNDDQAAIDALEATNQDTNVPALFESFGALGELCGFPADS